MANQTIELVNMRKALDDANARCKKAEQAFVALREEVERLRVDGVAVTSPADGECACEAGISEAKVAEMIAAAAYIAPPALFVEPRVHSKTQAVYIAIGMGVTDTHYISVVKGKLVSQPAQ